MVIDASRNTMFTCLQYRIVPFDGAIDVSCINGVQNALASIDISRRSLTWHISNTVCN